MFVTSVPKLESFASVDEWARAITKWLDDLELGRETIKNNRVFLESSATTTISNASPTGIEFNQQALLPRWYVHSTSVDPHELTVSKPGRYLIRGEFGFTATGAFNVAMYLAKNGSEYGTRAKARSSGTDYLQMALGPIYIELEAGDILSVLAQASTTGVAMAAGTNRLYVEKV